MLVSDKPIDTKIFRTALLMKIPGIAVFLLLAYLVWEFRTKKPSTVPLKYQCVLLVLLAVVSGFAWHFLSGNGLLRNRSCRKSRRKN